MKLSFTKINKYLTLNLIFQRWDDTLSCLAQAFANQYNYKIDDPDEMVIKDQSDIGIGNKFNHFSYCKETPLSLRSRLVLF